jgi:Fungal Zn(2)-Cys(6) binuclear cluster domain
VRHRRTRKQPCSIPLVAVSDKTGPDTNEKPFSCDICQATFPRADVQQKHMRRAHPEQSYGENWNEPTVVAATKKSRSKVACETCRKHKLRCSGYSPCSQCQASNQVCTFSRQTRTTSISSRHDELSGRPGQPTPEVMSDLMETVVDDTTAPGPEVPPSAATFSTENQWSTAIPQLLTPGLNQIIQPSNFRSRSHGQETAIPELSQFRTPADWLPSHDGLVLGEPDSFQNGVYGLADIGPADSLWHLDNFVSSAKANLSSVSWTDLLIPTLGNRLLA